MIFKWQYHHLKIQTLPGQQLSGSSLDAHYSCVDANQGFYEENASKKQNVLKYNKEIFAVVSIACHVKTPYCFKVYKSIVLSS